jgi:hypothetical protein
MEDEFRLAFALSAVAALLILLPDFPGRVAFIPQVQV